MTESNPWAKVKTGYLKEIIDLKEELLSDLYAEHQLALDAIQALITWYKSRMANEFFDPKEGGDAVWGPIIEAYWEDY